MSIFAIIKNMDTDTLVSLIEEKVKQVYSKEIEKLVKRGALTEEQGSIATKASNINDMIQKHKNNISYNSSKTHIPFISKMDCKPKPKIPHLRQIK